MGFFGKLWKGVKNIFSGIGNFVKSAFSGKNWWKTAIVGASAYFGAAALGYWNPAGTDSIFGKFQGGKGQSGDGMGKWLGDVFGSEGSLGSALGTATEVHNPLEGTKFAHLAGEDLNPAKGIEVPPPPSGDRGLLGGAKDLLVGKGKDDYGLLGHPAVISGAIGAGQSIFADPKQDAFDETMGKGSAMQALNKPASGGSPVGSKILGGGKLASASVRQTPKSDKQEEIERAMANMTPSQQEEFLKQIALEGNTNQSQYAQFA
jgi:hypothetical protein